MSPVAAVVTLAVVATVATVGALVLALREESGGSRRARRHDALRRIEQVNEGGHLVDLGTVKIDSSRWNRPDRYR